MKVKAGGSCSDWAYIDQTSGKVRLKYAKSLCLHCSACFKLQGCETGEARIEAL